ncbi:MAG: hypothetical protein RI933_843 [Actinomycetota bacterium]|uniref:Translocase n=1 Tax=Candidatus Rhodoluna planktonica TaxID=535712 RepID=A0A1D9DZT3_9MICO|nr:Sec-independent protein translocase TatB [Candidatus Rhodoluna planktonica]AOY56317.1 hypothetical protein A4Z71_04995 [Candidatus Rhodoluna planktonica]
MFGLSGEKLLILGLIAVFILGPNRLPYYSQQLAKFIKSAKRMADNAKGQLESEIGQEVDWKKLDPRQYDPRRIIRDALAEDINLNSTAKPASKPVQKLAPGEAAPFDNEAT